MPEGVDFLALFALDIRVHVGNVEGRSRSTYSLVEVLELSPAELLTRVE